MSLHLNLTLNGPFVVCDQCSTRINLSPNCCWGLKFVKISLKKLGMSMKGPQICEDCRQPADPAAPSEGAKCSVSYSGLSRRIG